VVMFPGDGTKLNAEGREQVRAAVTAFQQRGGTGFINVVGHSSSRTPNMPVEKHLVAIFAKSQQRANAVAAEIIRGDGVGALLRLREDRHQVLLDRHVRRAAGGMADHVDEAGAAALLEGRDGGTHLLTSLSVQ